MKVINLNDKLSKVDNFWDPKIVAELNDQQVKVAKLQGEFVWHKHDNEDELFFVVKGRLEIQFRKHSVFIEPGEICVIPRGVEHRPIAEQEVHIMLFEPSSTLNTGDKVNEYTKGELEKI